jgi:hypothetical protein
MIAEPQVWQGTKEKERVIWFVDLLSDGRTKET